MNRREFTKSLAAAAATPALPARALSLAAPAVPAVPGAILGVDQAAAEAVFEQLQHQGIISAPDACGFADGGGAGLRTAAALTRAANRTAPTAQATDLMAKNARERPKVALNDLAESDADVLAENPEEPHDE